jgi:hypothetical protein
MKDNTLVKQAYALNFKSYFGLMVSVREEAYLLWMEDFKAWFRNTHKMHITITSISQESWQYHCTMPGQHLGVVIGEDYESYEDALEDSLLTAIQLLQ